MIYVPSSGPSPVGDVKMYHRGIPLIRSVEFVHCTNTGVESDFWTMGPVDQIRLLTTLSYLTIIVLIGELLENQLLARNCKNGILKIHVI